MRLFKRSKAQAIYAAPEPYTDIHERKKKEDLKRALRKQVEKDKAEQEKAQTEGDAENVTEGVVSVEPMVCVYAAPEFFRNQGSREEALDEVEYPASKAVQEDCTPDTHRNENA